MRPTAVLQRVLKLTGGKAWNKPFGVATPISAKKNRKAGERVDAANRAALAEAAAREPSKQPAKK